MTYISAITKDCLNCLSFSEIQKSFEKNTTSTLIKMQEMKNSKEGKKKMKWRRMPKEVKTEAEEDQLSRIQAH